MRSRSRGGIAPGGVLGDPARESSGTAYVADADYDIFGRLELLRHGNGTDDVATFYGPAENFRLERLTTVRAGATTPYLDLQYHYDARGLIEGIDDLRNPTTDLSNSAAYDIDGLGRLRSVEWLAGASHDEVFDYDPRGNLTLIGGKTLEYPGKPHQALLRSGGTEMLYDSNGSRVQKLTPAETQTYAYDGLGRLSLGSLSATPTDPPTRTIQFTYDAGGDRVARVITTNGVAAPPRRFFNRFVDSYNGTATKYYWFGGRLVASQDVVTNALSEVPPGWVPPPREPPRLPLVLAVPLLGGMLLLLWGPGRRRVSLGVTVAPTRAAGVALAVLASSVPVLMGQQCGGGGGPPPVRHFHFDHLDSLQAVSDGPGALWRQIRYRSYGLVRGRYDGAGTAAPASEVTRHEFIGYQSEIETGLDYAYARFYDPELGQFLSHDPAGELPSPYAYTHGDPINFSDPSGQLVAEGLIAAGIFLAKIAIAVYATQVTINYARSGDWGFALDPGNAVTDPVPSHGGVPGLVGGPSLPNACNQGGIQVCNSLTIDLSTGGEMGIDLGAPELARLGAAIGAASGQGEKSQGVDWNTLGNLGQEVIGWGLIAFDIVNTIVSPTPDVGIVGASMVMSARAARLVRHHTVPKEILKQLPDAVANNPLVRGRAGAPNRWRIPESLHKLIHQGRGGGSYNQAWKQRLADLGRSPTVQDVLKIKNDLVKQFGLERFRP